MRDEFATCPRCDIALDNGKASRTATGTQLTCSKCFGALILDQDLYGLVSEAQIQALLIGKRDNPWRREEFANDLALGAPAQAEAGIRCPRCTATMAKHSLYSVLVDRCEAHGIWLDGNHELRDVLDGAAKRI